MAASVCCVILSGVILSDVPCVCLLQGLANMLWSYAKLPVAPPAVVFALVHKITDQLVMQSQRPDGASTFDAQVRLAAE
jgi:hypothetical protein